MSQTVKTIYDYIDSIAPFESASGWDNVGLLLGNYDSNVEKILLALDITEEVVDEAVIGQYNLIVTHHPLIFSGIKEINNTSRAGRMILKLIEHKISVIAAHTNLDRSYPFGINRYICELYGLNNLKVLNEEEGFGLVGTFDNPISFDDFIIKTKLLFDIDIVKIANLDHRTYHYYQSNTEQINEVFSQEIKKVAISSGASSDFIKDALRCSSDVFITSDIKYHEAQSVISTSLILVDVGHFESEFIYLNRLKSLLDAKLNHTNTPIVIKVTDTEMPVFRYL